MSSYKGKQPYRVCKIILILFLSGILFFSGLLALVVHGNRNTLQGEPKVMVVLGCQVMESGPSVLLQDRLNTALDYWQEHSELFILVSGGQGGNEPMSEAQAMRDYLVAHGVPQEQIWMEDQSHSTWQNLVYSFAIMEEEGYDATDDVLVVSNGFHLTRVRMLWSRLTGDQENLSTLAAPSSHVPSRLNMYIREPLALVKSFLFDRL